MSNAFCDFPVRNLHSRAEGTLGFCGCCALLWGYLLPTLAVLIILAFVVGQVQFFVTLMIHYPDALRITLGLSFLLIYLLLVGLALWSFLLVVGTSPGYVLPTPWRDPPRYEPRPRLRCPLGGEAPTNENNPTAAEAVGEAFYPPPLLVHSFPSPPFSSSTTEGGFVVSVLDHRTGALRYCARCELYMPDFAHHCRICQRCVYRMDHHCPWVNNCIGRNNYKLFVLFIFYLSTMWLTSMMEVAIGIFLLDPANIIGKVWWWFALLVLSGILGFSFLMFYLQHVNGVRRGRGTMDAAIRRRQKRSERRAHDFSGDPSDATTCLAETLERKENEKLRLAEYKCALFGEEKRFWRRWLPFPIRTDNNANEFV
ncbi:unnamed protein product [Phytomonas sp. Hart1]|nr:unnamed protein product [Phytomonas sp. Hart1]|eukprot:CCW67511.1 unnamed protein product [Phytomonas sp. isolate Hart1]